MIGSQESSTEKSKRCSWANIVSLIAAYKENYERLKTTNSADKEIPKHVSAGDQLTYGELYEENIVAGANEKKKKRSRKRILLKIKQNA